MTVFGRFGRGAWAKGLAVAALLGMGTTTGRLDAAGATERPNHSQARIAPAEERADKKVEETGNVPLEPAYRAHFGHCDMYVPTFFHPVQGAYDVIVHFHGLHEAQESNVERAHVNAVIVSVNLGMGSGPYEQAFKDPGAFPRVLANVERNVAKSGRAPGAHVGRIALSAWSAGYGAVSALLRNEKIVDRVDAVLLADGLHSDYANERRHIVDEAPLKKYARIVDAAVRGEKLFAITHSSILTTGYPNTTETVGELLAMTGTPKTPNAITGPRNMHQIYESNRGEFHVKGYQGTGVKDHIDHIWGMSETVYPYLRDRWSR